MQKLSIFIVLIYFTIGVKAQMVMDVGSQSSNWGSTSSVNVVDPSTIGKKKVELLNYDDIEGSPFYSPKWSKAFLYLKNGNLVKLNQVKLNMLTNEVYYINNNNTEMVLDAFNFKRVLIMKQEDTSRIAVVFDCYQDMADNTKGETFYRVLNGGSVQLLVLYKTILKTGAYDPLLGKDPKSFYTKKFYAISNAGAFSPIKILDRNTILPVIKSHQADEDWLNSNHNKLKNETEIISFLEYYNAKKN